MSQSRVPCIVTVIRSPQMLPATQRQVICELGFEEIKWIVTGYGGFGFREYPYVPETIYCIHAFQAWSGYDRMKCIVHDEAHRF